MPNKDYRFSVTVWCDDLPVLFCLRGLSMFSQQAGNVYTPWKGTGRDAWKHNSQQVTFRFTRPDYRERFLKEATRILPSSSWREKARSDNNPPPIS